MFVPFLESHSQLTEEETKILSDFKAEYPIRTEAEQEKSPVIEIFRAETEKHFNDINGYSPQDIETSVKEFVLSSLYDNDIKGEIGEVIVSGSRCRGLENDNSDIDVVVEIKGSDLKEDALFNIFHEKGMEIDGITVDVNPIRPEETGTLETYLPTVEEFLAEKAENIKNIEPVTQDNQRTVDDITVGDKYLLKDIFGEKEVTVSSMSGVYPDNIGITEHHKSGNMEYETISNIDKFKLHNQGVYLGNENDTPEKEQKSVKMILYHGTRAEDFDRFKPDYRGAVWTDTDVKHAAEYAGNIPESKVLTCEAELQNPAHLSYGSNENWDIDKTVREAKADGHDSVIIDFKFTESDNAYFKIMLENYPENSAKEALESMPDASASDALEGETVAEFAKRMKKNDNITHSYVAVFNPDAIKIVDRMSVYEPEIDSELKEAKDNINKFCQSEYGADADFSNLSKVDLAYTTDRDNGLAIQISADLE